MFKFRSRFYEYLAVLGIAFIVFLIYLTNFRGNFWISGWDNLHPEFNFATNLSRAFFSSWQEYQGLGLPAGHGHATELVREIILWLINSIIPAVTVRKIYILSMIFTGSLGVYVFIRNVVANQLEQKLKIILSFIAASFYILNLATVQLFYAPYEAFVACFAFLPWMIYSIYLFMRSPSRKTFLIFLLIQFLGTWQFYIPTLFIVYIFIAFCISLSLTMQNLKRNWKILAITLIGILIVNLYWLLPFGYYTLTNINSQEQAYTNLLYSQDAYVENARFGNLQDSALFKGFLFNYVSLSSDQTFNYTIGPWKIFVNHWYFLLIGYSLFTIAVFGLIYAIRKKQMRTLALLFVLFFGFLANQTFPFNLVNDLLRSSPLLNQVFRNPFTKFANFALFFMIIFFIYGLLQLINLLQNKLNNLVKNTLLIPFSILIIFLILINIYILPLWQGNFIYPPLKVNIPNEYFQVFDYFNHQPNGRIANLPQSTPNGWDYYQWGYQGSGFIWYGIKQPILDRAFDVWNKDNENYYWQLSQAIYSQNLPLFENILDKYQVNWLLLDGNVTTPGTAKILYTKQIENMLSSSSKITLDKQFGKIKIYSIKRTDNLNNFVYSQNSLPNIQPQVLWNDNDQAFTDYGNYYNSSKITAGDVNVFYPFRSLFTGRPQQERTFNLKETADSFILTTEIPEAFYTSTLVIPSSGKDEFTEIDNNDPAKISTKEATLLIDNTQLKINTNSFGKLFPVKLSHDNLEIQIPKINGYFANNTITSSNLANIKANNCNRFNQGSFDLTKLNSLALIDMTSIHSNNCIDFTLPNLTQASGYLLSVPTKHIQGKSLFISITNQESKKEEQAVYLPLNNAFTTSYFVLPPKEQYGLGYNIHLDNISLDNNKTINELGEMKINPFPYRFLSSIKLVSSDLPVTATNSQTVSKINVIHNSPYSYKLSLDGSMPGKYLILSQSFDKGWHLYSLKNDNLITSLFPFLFGTEIKQHLLINDWENGWLIDSINHQPSTINHQQIVIVYLPQYLEFSGLGLLLITLIITIVLSLKRPRRVDF